MGGYQELQRQVKDLISNNRTGEALEFLAKEQLSSLDKDLIILNSRYSKVTEDQRLGVIDDDVAQRRINTINRDLLDLAEKVRKPVEHSTTSASLLKNQPLTSLSNNKAFNKAWIIAPVLLAIAALIVFMLMRGNPEIEATPVTPPPELVQASFDWKCQNTDCVAPSEVQFTNSSENADEFLWDFGDGQISNLPDPMHTYMEGKTYSVTLTASSETGRIKVTKSIEVTLPPPLPVNEKPLPIANFEPNRSTCIAPCKVSFENLSRNATRFIWQVNGKKEASSRNYQKTFNSTGKYNIKLIASSGSNNNTYEQFVRIDAPAPPTSQPSSPSQSSGTFVHGGQTYKWLKLKDGKNWMAQNLNYKTPDSWCYQDKDANCAKYGRYYNFESAQKACPSGWHLPNDQEWKNMINAYGGKGPAYKSLVDSGNVGFNGLLSGHRYEAKGSYLVFGNVGDYWSSRETGPTAARFYRFDGPTKELTQQGNLKSYGFNCRCIQN
jgi:uncharacterized protein (TIGR02145 family)